MRARVLFSEYTYKSFEDYLYNTLCDGDGNISVARFLNVSLTRGVRFTKQRSWWRSIFPTGLRGSVRFVVKHPSFPCIARRFSSLQDIRRTGLRLDDPRLQKSMSHFNALRSGGARHATDVQRDAFMG